MDNHVRDREWDFLLGVYAITKSAKIEKAILGECDRTLKVRERAFAQERDDESCSVD